jgi:hypothetical protein
VRTTLEIDDDILQAAKELAAKHKSSTGQVISGLARRALNLGGECVAQVRSGVPLLPSRGEVVSLDHVQKLMDQEGV